MDPETNLPAQPLPPPPETERSKDLKRAAAMGQKRTEKEKELKDNILKGRQEQEKRSHEFLEQSVRAKDASKEKKKEYRSMMRTRGQELEADKKRREKQIALTEEAAHGREKLKKKRLGYMKELHDAAQIKFAMEQRENALKAEYETARRKAAYEHRTKMEEAESKRAATLQQAERDARARKTGIDSDMHAKEYELEGWKRMHSARLESEANRLLSMRSRTMTPVMIQEHRMQVEQGMRPLRKRLENDFKEKKVQIETEAQRLKHENDEDMRTKKAMAENDYKRTVHTIDNELARRLEEADTNYKKGLFEAQP